MPANDPHAHEYVTEILDEQAFRTVLSCLVQLLALKGVTAVQSRFGFVVERDLKGLPQGNDQTIALDRLQTFIEAEMNEGTIEWNGTSDFIFSAVHPDITFKLCNDADLHFSSSDTKLLSEVEHVISSLGVNVYRPNEDGEEQ